MPILEYFEARHQRTYRSASAPRTPCDHRTRAGRASGQSREALLQGMGRIFRDLPGETFPVLKALAGERSKDDFEGLFQFGMEVWIGGLERRLASGKASVP